MDERISEPGKPPSLRDALRRARADSAEQQEARSDVRQAETARLGLMEDAIRAVLDQKPDDADLFDLGLTHGEKPRLFLDPVAFVDLAHDRRTYRFFQDTRHGRVPIAESDKPERIVAAVTNYVARRLVEREQALAADWRSRAAPNEPAPPSRRLSAVAAPRRGWRLASDAFGFFLMTLGSVTLCVGVFLAAQAGWEAWGRAFWIAHLGKAPF